MYYLSIKMTRKKTPREGRIFSNEKYISTHKRTVMQSIYVPIYSLCQSVSLTNQIPAIF